MQSGFWKADWFLGVLVVALFALFNSMSDVVPGLERKAYDAALPPGPGACALPPPQRSERGGRGVADAKLRARDLGARGIRQRRRGARAPERRSGRRWRHPQRGTGGVALRRGLSVALGLAGRAQPEPRA